MHTVDLLSKHWQEHTSELGGGFGSTGKFKKGRENLKAQEELEKILTEEALIESKIEELIRLDSLAKKMTAALNGETVSGSKNLDPMGTVIANKEKLFCEIMRLQEVNEKRKEYLAGIIDGLKKPVFIKILYGRYFNGKSLNMIAIEEGYCYRNICYIHGNALQAVEKIMGEGGSFHTFS